MKKRIILAIVAIALLVLAFALTASAEDILVNTITSEAYGTVYQLSADPGLDNAKQYVSTLNTIEDLGTDKDSLVIMTDGNYYYVFPSTYIFDEHTQREIGKFSITLTKGAGNNYSSTQKGINDVFAEWNEAEGTSLPTFAFSGSWGNSTFDCLVRLEVPTDVKFVHRSHCLIKSDTLVEIVFPAGVSITNAGGCFYGNDSLTTVTLPTGITAIPNDFFCDCIALTTIVNWDAVKNSITSVGNYAFYNCDSLVSVSLPALTSIGNQAFAYCAELKTVDLTGSSFVKLNSAFRNCPKLESINLPDTVDGISQDGFHACSSLTYLKIPRNATYIGNYAFNGCSSLATLDMSEAMNLKSTGNNTFNGAGITELIFPEGFETFGGFGSASKLTYVYFPNSTKSIGGIQFGKMPSYTIPLGVTVLKGKTLDYCSTSTVTIHKGVTSVDSQAFYGMSVATIIYTGSESDAVVAQIKTAAPKATIVYADHCETYFGAHAWSGNAEMLPVDYFKGVFYADNCTREGCGIGAIDETKTIGALFNYLGYSYTEVAINGAYSMSQFYSINKANVSEYVARTGNSFEFGLVVASVDNPLGSEFEGTSKVLVAPQSNIVHNYFDVKVYGISEKHTTSEIVFCAFVKDGDTVYYLDNGVTSETVECKSFEDVKTLENAKAE